MQVCEECSCLFMHKVEYGGVLSDRHDHITHFSHIIFPSSITGSSFQTQLSAAVLGMPPRPLLTIEFVLILWIPV